MAPERCKIPEPIECVDVRVAELAPQRPEGRPPDQGVASRIFVLLRRSDFGVSEDVMHNAVLGLDGRRISRPVWIRHQRPNRPGADRAGCKFRARLQPRGGRLFAMVEYGRAAVLAVSKIGSVAHLTKLTREQFQFVRALYVAIPPISRALPPGDSAVVASVSGRSMIALVSGGDTCARFLAPDFALSMRTQVGKGESVAAGDPI
jgi:hypothetical protein